MPMQPRPRTPTCGPPLPRVVVRTPPSWPPALAGPRRLASARDGAPGLDREPVDEVVHRVAGVTLHPAERDVPAVADGGHQRLPQVPVGHRLLGAVHPAPAQPPPPPAVP